MTGQQIVIPGSKTPTYIPPTGIEVVPDTSVDDSGRQVTPQLAREMLASFELRKKAAPAQRGGPSHTPTDVDLSALLRDLYNSIDRGEMTKANFASSLSPAEYRTFEATELKYRRAGQPTPDALKYAAKEIPAGALMRVVKGVSPDYEEPVIDADSGTVGGMAVAELEAVASGPRLVRQAVVLGPTEFCVLLDADGRPQIHRGPGRVFPGPYDRFRTLGSRNRVYDAYHLRSDRGLLLRIVTDSISKDKLMGELPQGMPSETLEKRTYLKGDEVFIGGFDAYLVPSNSFEVINPGTRIEASNPLTRSPHIGNDHTAVYVQAIGVDQKSGVYVANVDTGNVELVRGEKKLLLDPRKSRHMKRRVPGRAWNLIIGRAEPHKRVPDDKMVETPWALSVIVPNNEAILVTSKTGRRVVVGPRTELLGYEEWLEKLTLSRGRPKSEDDKLETCFLRVSGNRVTDRVELETADFVTIKVDVAYGVTFVADKEADQFQWFDHRNYVRLLYTHLRSRLRAAARKMAFMDLQPIIPDFVRDIVLGGKPAEGHRAGLRLPNNMLVDEVEVLDIVIPDATVAQNVVQAQQASVVRQITDASLQAELKSEELRDGIAQRRQALTLGEIERKKTLGITQAEADNAAATKEAELRQQLDQQSQDAALALALSKLKADIDRENQSQKAKLAREKQANDQKLEMTAAEVKAKAEADRLHNQLEAALKKDLADIEKVLLEAGAEAAVKQLVAIQPGLIEAIKGMGDAQLAKSLAENLPKAGGTLGFLFEAGGFDALRHMVRGTRLESALAAVGDGTMRSLKPADTATR